MIEQATIQSVIGVTKTFAGRGVLLDCQIEDRGNVEALVLRHEFPVGLIQSHMIGMTVDVIVEKWGDKAVATVLPLEHQGSATTSRLLSKLVQVANKTGQAELDCLPVARRSKAGDPQPKPHLLAEHLEKLLEQVPDSDTEQDDDEL